MDRHSEDYGRFFKFSKFAYKLKSYNTNVLIFQVEILYGSSRPG